MKTENNFHLSKDIHHVVIREGKALEPKEPIAVVLAGVLDSPFQWLSKRINQSPLIPLLGSEENEAKQMIEANKGISGELHGVVAISSCYVLVNREYMSITLIIGENNHYQTQIIGALQFHPAFQKFKINQGEYITPFEMADLIKMNRTFFENKDAAMSLVHTLKNFKAKVDKQVEAADDNRGNKRALIEQAVDSNLPERFKMCLPIFKGQPSEIIEVEVYIRASDLTCTLISPEANEIEEELRNSAIDSVINKIKDIAPELAIIEQ